jgi:hypothetical protein
MIDVSYLFLKGMGLGFYNSIEREKIMKLVLQYILGVEGDYKDTVNALKEFAVERYFANSIKAMNQAQINYTVFHLRKQAWYHTTRNLQKWDGHWTKKLHKQIDYKQIRNVKHIIPVKDVLKTLNGSIWKVTNNVYSQIKSDHMIGKEDIFAELQFKVCQVYAQYIFSYNLRNWNDKVFYSNMHQGIRRKGSDIVRYATRDMRVVNTDTQQYQEGQEKLPSNRFLDSSIISRHSIEYRVRRPRTIEEVGRIRIGEQYIDNPALKDEQLEAIDSFICETSTPMAAKLQALEYMAPHCLAEKKKITMEHVKRYLKMK